ncbi:hypothetical protein QJQ45_009708 [Haematococcus lacustris]|nr:hypothetical protein QJQ45_009708 [Haematococcus lacustris]
MDYSAEQAMELEALQAIYDDELQVYTGTTPAGWSDTVGETYKITITPLEEGEELQEGSNANTELSMELLFAHTQSYPDSPPCFKLRAVYGLSDADLAACSQCLAEQVQQNLGMAMVFTLITSAKEWLRATAALAILT